MGFNVQLKGRSELHATLRGRGDIPSCIYQNAVPPLFGNAVRAALCGQVLLCPGNVKECTFGGTVKMCYLIS